jgi:hypothetical protein
LPDLQLGRWLLLLGHGDVLSAAGPHLLAGLGRCTDRAIDTLLTAEADTRFCLATGLQKHSPPLASPLLRTSCDSSDGRTSDCWSPLEMQH